MGLIFADNVLVDSIAHSPVTRLKKTNYIFSFTVTDYICIVIS